MSPNNANTGRGGSSSPPSVSESSRRLRRFVFPWLFPCGSCLLIILFAQSIYDFLALPGKRIQADILIIEGWSCRYGGPQAAAAEYDAGRCSLLAISGLARSAKPGLDASAAHEAARQLSALGVPESKIIVCPAAPTRWNRTSASARAVRDQLAARGIRYGGVNIVTIGPHARQTRLAYRRIMGPGVRVGIITVPKQGLDTGRWWASAHGWKMVVKDFAGWFKECIFGYRK